MQVATSASDPDRHDIAELVRQHTVLLPNGPDGLRGSCPFCESWAFHVRTSHGTFHCLNCGEGGDAGAFAAKIAHRR